MHADIAPDEARKRIFTLLYFLSDNYFRTTTIVHEPYLADLNKKTNIVFAANHSGMSFPWDSLMTHAKLESILGHQRELKSLSFSALSKTRLMSLFGLDRMWSHLCSNASFQNFDSLAANEKNVFIHPEGAEGLIKGFQKKYQLQKFSRSMIHICLKHDIPLVPISIVNAEYLHPYCYKLECLNRVAKKIGLPFFPLSIALVPLLLLPAILYMVYPAKLYVVIEKSINLKSLISKKYEELSDAEIRILTEQIQDLMQKNLLRNVDLYGKKPFDWLDFLKHANQLGPDALRLIPLTWPWLFHFAQNGPLRFSKESFFSWFRSILICTSQCWPIYGWPLYIFCLKIFPLKKKNQLF